LVMNYAQAPVSFSSKISEIIIAAFAGALTR
jgi:hypothetical protein